MDYLWTKAGHVAAVLIWTGGLFLQTMVLVTIGRGRDISELGRSLALAAHTWDRKVTTPALLIVWAMGLWAAVAGHWFGHPWLSVKLVAVVALSGMHGIQTGALRRIATGAPFAPANVAWRPIALIVTFASIAVLAVVKPTFGF